MDFETLKEIYKRYKEKYGPEAYKFVSAVLREAKQLHKKDWENKPTGKGDHEQSWRAFKGKNLEKLIHFILKDEIEALGLRVIEGSYLERASHLSKELGQVKRNVLVDYGKYGCHLPDIDLIIYLPENSKVIAVISSKVTLRERIAQTGYWKLKLLQDEITKHIKVYFITPDEDGTLTKLEPIKKGRAIVETELDGTYLLTEEEVEQTDKVKLFENFISDLKNLLENEKIN